jgi:flagellar motor protein MotB
MKTIRSKSKSSSDEQGYLVSVSDLMSTLFFIVLLFLLFFIISSLITSTSRQQLESDIKDLQERNDLLTVENDFLIAQNNELLPLKESFAEWSDARLIREQLLTEIKFELEIKGIEVEIDKENGILRLPTDILFPSGSADLTHDGESAIAILAKILENKLPCYSGILDDEPPTNHHCPEFLPGKLDGVLIEGHTDSVPIGKGLLYKFPDNIALSSVRSANTWRFLEKCSAVLASLQNAQGESLFGVSGYGENRGLETRGARKKERGGENPYESKTPEEMLDLNRRIDIRFLLAAPPRTTDPAPLLAPAEEMENAGD